MKKILGVLGGLGPMSSAYFYKLVTENTLAKKDQDHLDIVISSRASTPDRTEFILGRSEKNPLPVMVKEAKKLITFGAEVIALTCNTAHYFYEGLQEAVSVPVLNIGSLAVEHIKESGISSVGLLATEGTVKCGIYQQACKEKGIECLVLLKEEQKIITDIIYRDIKAGKPANMESFAAVVSALKNRGACGIIMGCTELSLIKSENTLDGSFFDPLEILARASILSCGGKLQGKQ